ncbi:VapE domain-containing protein [uncultured Dialister sp.]|uniref:phage NrS-1 polymerase family protein n=1 Tax=uncultured Dialister sp. TaxID=278064 RepID=UPI0027DE032B|nr:VapE domain-containing protein [uncultured Dialister sp.]
MDNELIKTLAPFPRWICWAGNWAADKKGNRKLSKRPYGMNGTGRLVMMGWDDPKALTTYEDAKRRAEQLKRQGKEVAGIGFSLTRGLTFVCTDLDHCLDSAGNLKNDENGKRAQKVLSIFKKYGIAPHIERSPSGTGLHVWGKLEENKGYCKNKNGIELYSDKHFITVTGDPYNNTPLSMVDPAIDEIIKEFHLMDQAAAPAAVTGTAAGMAPTMEDRSIIEVIRKSKQREKFHSLYDLGEMGAYGDDHSSADAALISMLAYYTKDPEQLERIFLSSALGQDVNRKKHHEADYLKRTIKKALAKVTEGYNPKEYAAQKQAEELNRDFDDALISGGEEEPEHKDALRWPHAHKTAKGAAVPIPHTENLQYFLENVLHVAVRLNTVSKKLEFSGDGAKDFTGTSADAYGQKIKDKLQEYGVRGYSLKETLNQLNTIAEMHKYSPVCDYLNQCEREYDGEDYAHRLFSMLELNPDIPHDENFCYRLFLKWFVSAVQIAHNSPALKKPYTTQGVLVFIGPQGIGKTRFFREVVLKEHPEWFVSGERFSPSDKDSAMLVWICWIFELSEFNESVSKKRQNDMKSYIDKPIDRIRPPYAAGTKEFVRSTILFGTSNTVKFLNDETGNRRYWPIPLKAIHMDKDFQARQFWGQIMKLWKSGEVVPYLEPDKGDYEKLNRINESHREKSDTEQVILAAYKWDAPADKWKHKTATDIVTEIEDYLRTGERYTPTGVGMAMRSIMRDNYRVKYKAHFGYWMPPRRTLSAVLDHELDEEPGK